MGFWSTFHAFEAGRLAKLGRFREAAEHALQSGGELWAREESAASLLQRGELYKEAIVHFRKALKARPGRADWCHAIAQCHEALGEYAVAMDLYFETMGPRGHFVGVYDQYKVIRDRAPWFRLSRERLRDLCSGLLEGGPVHGSFHHLSEEDQQALLAELQAQGLTSLALEAFEYRAWRHHSSEVTTDHLRVAELAKKQGDLQKAERLYERFNLLAQAADCYRQSGKLGKYALYLLAEGRAEEAIAVSEKEGRPEEARAVREMAGFRLAEFEHPLRLESLNLDTNRREYAFSRIEDQYQLALEYLLFSGKPVLYFEAVTGHAIADIRHGYRSAGPLLPIELETLLHKAGDRSTADMVAEAMAAVREGLRKPEGERWHFQYGLGGYVWAGAFFLGALLGENALDTLEELEKTSYRFSLLGEVSRCYEASGCFAKAIEWKEHQIAECELKDAVRQPRDLYRDLARIHLKAGRFAEAGKAFWQHCLLSQEGASDWTIHEDGLLAADLCRWGKNRAGSAEIVATLIERSRAKGTLRDLLEALKRLGFEEAAARVTLEIG